MYIVLHYDLRQYPPLKTILLLLKCHNETDLQSLSKTEHRFIMVQGYWTVLSCGSVRLCYEGVYNFAATPIMSPSPQHSMHRSN